MDKQNHTVDKESLEELREKLSVVYAPAQINHLLTQITDLVSAYRNSTAFNERGWVDETDVILITYGDTIIDEERPTLDVLNDFLCTYVSGFISNVHILPCFTWTSDDGFAVVDYRAINPKLGDWTKIKRLSENFGLMIDAVINHISRESSWFRGFLNDDPRYRDYFHICDPSIDRSHVIRPRELPLLTRVETVAGKKFVWTTFSEDQIDLNYSNPDVLVEILDLLLFYAANGSRFLRLDAIGFLWKKSGTTCMHLPETHALIQVIRYVLNMGFPDVMIITETNVPHSENISYFGDGTNEAHMVYQFPLPPLTLYAFQTGNAQSLTNWADSLEDTSSHNTYFNFLSSHDGIGVRPAEGILTREDVATMTARVKANGGKVSMRTLPSGEKAPYEFNITFLDAISASDDSDQDRAAKFLAAQTILLSVIGVPGIYIHSLLGSRNDYRGLQATGRHRSINREKLDLTRLVSDLSQPSHLRSLVFSGLRQLLMIRRTRPAFHPNSKQRILRLDRRIFSLVRAGQGDRVWSIINVSAQTVSVTIQLTDIGFRTDSTLVDLISGHEHIAVDGVLQLDLLPYATLWIVEKGHLFCSPL